MKYIDPESKKEIRMPGIFPILKNYPGKVRFLGKNLGSDNLEIYRDLINLTETEIADLKKKGIIWKKLIWKKLPNFQFKPKNPYFSFEYKNLNIFRKILNYFINFKNRRLLINESGNFSWYKGH